MILLTDRDALLAALETPLVPVLNSLLSETVARAEVSGLLDLTYVLIVERDDDGDAITDKIGFSPFADPTDGTRFDQVGFEPYWAHLRYRAGWYELIHTVSNDGFAFILLIDCAGPAELVKMCERYIDVVPL